MTWISRFKYGDPDDLEYQKQILTTSSTACMFMMTYNYKDCNETISLDAVQHAFGSDLASDAPMKKARPFDLAFCHAMNSS